MIIAHIAREPALTAGLQVASDSEVYLPIDEMLRLDDPFVSNRRVTSCPVRIGDHDIPNGARTKLNWTSADRDEAVFGDNGFDPERNASANLVCGEGKHPCPGRLLATWELRIATRALLSSVHRVQLAPVRQPDREGAPVGRYRRAPVILT